MDTDQAINWLSHCGRWSHLESPDAFRQSSNLREEPRCGIRSTSNAPGASRRPSETPSFNRLR
jgi:hypothetical protein